MQRAGALGLEKRVAVGTEYAYESDVASAFELTSWSPRPEPAHRDAFLRSLRNASLVFGLCHFKTRARDESTVVRNTSRLSKRARVGAGRASCQASLRERAELERKDSRRSVSFQMTDGDSLVGRLAAGVARGLRIASPVARTLSDGACRG